MMNLKSQKLKVLLVMDKNVTHSLEHVVGVLGRPMDTFFWALIISWSRLLARVRSGLKQA
jgi:hypothetical protein